MQNLKIRQTTEGNHAYLRLHRKKQCQKFAQPVVALYLRVFSQSLPSGTYLSCIKIKIRRYVRDVETYSKGAPYGGVGRI